MEGFSGSGWSKLSGENSLDKKTFGDHWERAFPPVFWQSGCDPGVFSTGTEKKELSGFSGIDIDKRRGK
jgi:hypothetical protein